MTAKYWIKLYHEILHDPKMARMDDRLWRRTIELFLLAGEHGDDGSLPSLADMAWTMRTDVEQLETELAELQRLGIVSVVDGVYIVSKFADRQAANSPAERMRMMRERNKREQYYGNEAVTCRNTEPEREKRREEVEEERGTQLLLERIVGLPANPQDIPGIDELTELKIEECDIRGALQWRVDSGLGPVKRLSQLFPGIKTEHSKRIQNGNARKNGKPSEPDVFEQARAKLRAEGKMA